MSNIYFECSILYIKTIVCIIMLFDNNTCHIMLFMLQCKSKNNAVYSNALLFIETKYLHT